MPVDPAGAVAAALAWFEGHSGWAPPDHDTLAEWMADGVCRCPDECLVVPRGWCEHGLASWWLILAEVDGTDGLPVPDAAGAAHPRRLDPNGADDDAILAAHRRAVERGEGGYTDPFTGLFVMTARYLWDRGRCCESGCRHCPYPESAPRP